MPLTVASSLILLHRLHPHSWEYRQVYEELDSSRAGFNGESRVDRKLQELFPMENFMIIPNLILQIRPKQMIEIDTLIITDRYCLALEIKALRGTVRFNTNPFSIEVLKDGNTAERECPQIQLIRVVEGLETWLEDRGFSIPVYGFLTFAYRNVRVESPPTLVPLTFAEELPYKIRQLNSQLPKVLSVKDFGQLVGLLEGADRPFNPFPLGKYYRMDRAKIKNGLFCRTCGSTLTKKSTKTWWCGKCSCVVPDGPLRALEEWFMFVDTSISNEQCREWLGLKDKYAAGYLLRNTNLEPIGRNRARRYQLREENSLKVEITKR